MMYVANATPSKKYCDPVFGADVVALWLFLSCDEYKINGVYGKSESSSSVMGHSSDRADHHLTEDVLLAAVLDTLLIYALIIVFFTLTDVA